MSSSPVRASSPLDEYPPLVVDLGTIPLELPLLSIIFAKAWTSSTPGLTVESISSCLILKSLYKNPFLIRFLLKSRKDLFLSLASDFYSRGLLLLSFIASYKLKAFGGGLQKRYCLGSTAFNGFNSILGINLSHTLSSITELSTIARSPPQRPDLTLTHDFSFRSQIWLSTKLLD